MTEQPANESTDRTHDRPYNEPREHTHTHAREYNIVYTHARARYNTREGLPARYDYIPNNQKHARTNGKRKKRIANRPKPHPTPNDRGQKSEKAPFFYRILFLN